MLGKHNAEVYCRLLGYARRDLAALVQFSIDTISGLDKQVNLEPFGVVFTKIWARERGVNPVWYIDATPAPVHNWLVNHIDTLIKRPIEENAGTEIFHLTPFFEVTGTWNSYSRTEFWWEREWRKVGDLGFSRDDLVAVLAPEEYHQDLADALRGQHTDTAVRELTFLDPTWGLERMIGRLAGIGQRHLGPLPLPPPGR